MRQGVGDDSSGLLRKSDSVLMNKAQCVWGVWVGRGCVRLHWVGFPSSLSHPKISKPLNTLIHTSAAKNHNKYEISQFYVLQLLHLDVCYNKFCNTTPFLSHSGAVAAKNNWTVSPWSASRVQCGRECCLSQCAVALLSTLLQAANPRSSYIDKQMGESLAPPYCPLQHCPDPPKPPQSAISTLSLIRPHHSGPPTPQHPTCTDKHFRLFNKLSKPGNTRREWQSITLCVNTL